MNGIHSKPKLQFSSNGTFRILMMSDIQESASYDTRSLLSVCALLDKAKPDLVILGGDNCDGNEIDSTDDLKAFLDVFTAPMIERGIPWAHIFGNHDHDAPIEISVQQEIYESYPICVSSHTDDSIHGKTNFVLPVYDRTGENILFNVWGLDTNNRANSLNSLVPNGNMLDSAILANNHLHGGCWEGLYFDQLMWYWNTSCEMEKISGRKIPGMLCMHIAPHEFKMAYTNSEKCVKYGNFTEELSTGVFNSGLFAEILQRGDIRTIACGHTHKNDFEAEYCGIRLCWDACTGYRCYGIDELRGGRAFEITESDCWNLHTEMIYTQSLL